ncbi:MAG TPA: hypothetical protein VK638_41570 [Edaphobacter sp.]|nr:hypothetical protein [Edaphobacter sp.]
MIAATLPYWRVTREEQAWGDDGGVRGKRRQTDERIPPGDWPSGQRRLWRKWLGSLPLVARFLELRVIEQTAGLFDRLRAGSSLSSG